MKRIILVGLVILISLSGYFYLHQPKPKPAAPHHKPPVVQLARGVHTPYTDCAPNKSDTSLMRQHQQQIGKLATEMAKYNDVPNNVNNPDFQSIEQVHDQLIAEYDTCTLVTD